MVCSLAPSGPKKSKAPAKSKRPREEESTSEAPNDEDPAVDEAPRPKRKASSKSPYPSHPLKTDACCPLGRLTIKVKAPAKASSSRLPRKCSYVPFPISDHSYVDISTRRALPDPTDPDPWAEYSTSNLEVAFVVLSRDFDVDRLRIQAQIDAHEALKQRYFALKNELARRGAGADA